jgi:serine/threonine-protein kinase
MGAHIMSPPPRPSLTGPRVGAAFDAVVTRGMAKQPEHRFSTAGDLARAANAAALAAQVPTAPEPEIAETQTTYRIPAPPLPQSPPARTGSGRGQWVLAAAAAGVLAVVIGLVLWFAFGQNRTERVTSFPTITATATATSQATSSSAAPSPVPVPPALPGTDAQGFIDYPGARCDAGNSPTALARTTHSVLVVCHAGPGYFYYRGVRLSDGAGIELANAVRSSDGFDVTNPTDGTRYQIRRDALTIVPPDGQAVTEPMVEYASS